MVKEIQQGQLILASKSPRRRYLLDQAGLQFDIIPSGIDEHLVAQTDPVTYVQSPLPCQSIGCCRLSP